MFFIHERGTINATYLTAVMVGSFLTRIAAGAQAFYQGWRWSYYALSISLTILWVLFVVAYEETKYVPAVEGVRDGEQDDLCLKAEAITKSTNMAPSRSVLEPQQPVPLKPYRERLAWFTTTGESLWKLFYFPLFASGFPHVAFTSLQYASGVTWLVVQSSIISMVFSAPPYNFTTAGLGYLGLGPFVGNLIGSFYGGVLGDWAVRFFSRKNGGYYEPEYRLYHLLLPCFAQAGGIVMFGATVARVSEE
jgi:MFS family permease